VRFPVRSNLCRFARGFMVRDARRRAPHHEDPRLHPEGDDPELDGLGRYCFFPTWICIAFLSIVSGIFPISETAAMPSAFRALARLTAGAPNSNALLSSTWMNSPLSALSPSDGRSGRVHFKSPDGHSRSIQFADFRVGSSSSTNLTTSESLNSERTNGTAFGDRIFANTSAYCSAVRDRGANLISSAMIFDCCALLIPSSKTNRKIVQTASTATPPITSLVATRWIVSEYFGDSNMMPAATAKLASTVTDSKMMWGQVESTPPEKKLLKYVSIAAVLGWVFVAALAPLNLAFRQVRDHHHPEKHRSAMRLEG
jgi:hypothetical protein